MVGDLIIWQSSSCTVFGLCVPGALPWLRCQGRGEVSPVPAHVQWGHRPRLCLLFVSRIAIKPLGPWDEVGSGVSCCHYCVAYSSEHCRS